MKESRQAYSVLRRLLIPVFMLAALLNMSALEVPRLEERITDQANIISSKSEQKLNSYLRALEEGSGAQVAVLTIPSLEGESLEQFSIQVVDEWQLGSAEKDNGVLLLIALAEKKIRIEVGYGLEGELTDIKSGFIIREILQPRFRQGDYDGGIVRAVETIGGVVSGNADIQPEQIEAARESSSGRGSGASFNTVIFLIILIIGGLGRRRRGGLGRALFWGALLGSSSRRRYSSGSGFGGGFSGGGFSGGGGGFGGGGASGGW